MKVKSTFFHCLKLCHYQSFLNVIFFLKKSKLRRTNKIVGKYYIHFFSKIKRENKHYVWRNVHIFLRNVIFPGGSSKVTEFCGIRQALSILIIRHVWEWTFKCGVWFTFQIYQNSDVLRKIWDHIIWNSIFKLHFLCYKSWRVSKESRPRI